MSARHHWVYDCHVDEAHNLERFEEETAVLWAQIRRRSCGGQIDGAQRHVTRKKSVSYQMCLILIEW